MRIALAQLNYHVGNFQLNTEKIITTIQQVREQKADLVIFPELAICGYPAKDFLESPEFIERCQKALQDIAIECQNIACIVGSPRINPMKRGKRILNSAFFIEKGSILAISDKAFFLTHDIFDQYRYFDHGSQFHVISFKNKKIALTICEDLRNVDEGHSLSQYRPMEELYRQNPDIIINIAASPFDYRHREQRIDILRKNSVKYNLPIVYVNHVGAQTDLIFDGGSLVLNKKGVVEAELPYFREAVHLLNWEQGSWIPLSTREKPSSTGDSETMRIYDALILGIRDYFYKSGFKKALIGLSGGIDSAVVLALAEEALGKDHILAVLMPSQYSSDHSVSDSLEMIKRLGCAKEILPIETIFNTFRKELNPIFKDLAFNIAEENLQARIRSVLLMAISNKLGYILLNTSNKSEIAVGYGTLYGDTCGGLSVIGDVYKTQVYALAHYINEKKNGIIPKNILIKEPSAELRSEQKDSNSLPDYDILDKILYQYIEKRKNASEISAMGFDAFLIQQILHLVNVNEYKRNQAPPILRVSPKAFGAGRNMPIEGKYAN